MDCSATHAGVAEVSGVVDFSGVHADPVHPIDVLSLNPANGQAKLMVWCCRNTCSVWSSIIMLKYSTDKVHVRNDVMLQDLVSPSSARQCTRH